MSDQTNKLIELAKDLGIEGTIDPEYDALVSSGRVFQLHFWR